MLQSQAFDGAESSPAQRVGLGGSDSVRHARSTIDRPSATVHPKRSAKTCVASSKAHSTPRRSSSRSQRLRSTSSIDALSADVFATLFITLTHTSTSKLTLPSNPVNVHDSTEPIRS